MMKSNFFKHCVILATLITNPLLADNSDSYADICLRGQEFVAGALISDLPKITVEVKPDTATFRRSKSAVTSEGVEVFSYHPELRERGSEYDEVWCKFRSRESLAEFLGDGNDQGKVTCADVQKELLKDPLSDRNVSYKFNFTDKGYLTGSSWLGSRVGASWVSVNEIEFTSQKLHTTTLIEKINGIERFGGAHYCKLISPFGFSQLLDDLDRHEKDKLQLPKKKEQALQIMSERAIKAKEVRWDKKAFGAIAKAATLIYDPSQSPAVGVSSI